MAALPPTLGPRTAPSTAAVHGTLLLVQAAFGSLAVAGKLAVDAGLAPLAIAWVRVVGAALFFAGLWFARRRAQPAELKPPTRRDLLAIGAVGLLGTAVNQVLFLSGLERTEPVNASVLVTTIPVFTLVVAAALGKEALTRRRGVGVTLAFAGVLYLVGLEALEVGLDTVVGDLLVILQSLSYATFLVLIKERIEKHGSLTVVAVAFSTSGLVLLPLGAPAVANASFGWSEVALLAYMVAVPTIFTYLANAWALRFASRSLVAVYIYLQPVAAAVIAAAVYGTVPSSRVYVGATLVFLGIFIITRQQPEPA